MNPEFDDPLQEVGQSTSAMFRSGVAALSVGIQHTAILQAVRHRRGEQDANQATLDAASRLRAEKAVAGELGRRVSSPQWWRDATTTEVAQAVAVASAWEGSSPQAASALEKLRQGIAGRPDLKAPLLAEHPQLAPVIDLPGVGPAEAKAEAPASGARGPAESAPPSEPGRAQDDGKPTTRAGMALAVAAETPGPQAVAGSPGTGVAPGDSHEFVRRISQSFPATGRGAQRVIHCEVRVVGSQSAQMMARVGQGFPAGIASPLAGLSRSADAPGAGTRAAGLVPAWYRPQAPSAEPDPAALEL